MRNFRVDGDRAAADVIAVSDLCPGYGQIPVLKHVAMHVGPGEVVVFLGANGAGRTTTLLTLAGVIKPSGGTVRWLGAPTSARSERLPSVGSGAPGRSRDENPLGGFWPR